VTYIAIDPRLACVSEHTFRKDMLTPGGWVLDAGARDFKFAKYCAKLGCKVISLDPSKDVRDPHIDGIYFEPSALVAHCDDNEERLFIEISGEDNRIIGTAKDIPEGHKPYHVVCTTINLLMRKYNVVGFDLVKLDIESSEYAIMRRWPGPITRQISVEFHDFMGLNPSPDNPNLYYDAMLTQIEPWYRPVLHGPPFKDCLYVRA
jgi:FkbM family methyltransferase